MSWKIQIPSGVGGVYSDILQNRNRHVAFGNTLHEDTFQYSSLDYYVTENSIRKMIDANPKIKGILKNHSIELNMAGLDELMKGHATETKNIALGIIDKLPFSLKGYVDEKAVTDAAYLHDIGKVLIPTNILNKQGRLDEHETEIMHKHSELGYELLKTTGISPKTLNLIRNHHQNAKRSGYPFVGKDFNADLNLQIVSVADKYSALTEKRVYKDRLTPKEALTIIYRDVQEEKLHPFVFKALVNYVNSPSLDVVANSK